MKKLIPYIILLLGSLIISSCVYVVETKVTGHVFNHEYVYKIQKNITSKQDILQMLKAPYIWQANNKTEEWTYLYETVKEKKIFTGFLLFYGVNSKELVSSKKAVLMFDSAGVVRNINYTEIGDSQTIPTSSNMRSPIK